jgi:Ca2+-binding RTX toxin-like protein
MLMFLLPLLGIGLLAAAIGSGGSDGTDAHGTEGNDTLEGTGGNDTLSGLGGDDDIFGLGGNDLINAGAGDDAVSAGDGNDTVTGGTGDDILLGDAGNDLMRGGSGSDLMYGGTGSDAIYAGSGADEVAGGRGDDRVFLDGGDDYYGALSTEPGAGYVDADFTSGNDLVRGGDGNDLIVDAFGSDTLWGDLGNDSITSVDDPTSHGADLVYGGFGADTLTGDDGDTLSGGAGTDKFAVSWESGDGPVEIADFLRSGNGTDVVYDGDETLVIQVDNWHEGMSFSTAETADGLQILIDGETVAQLNGVVLEDFPPDAVSLYDSTTGTYHLPVLNGFEEHGTDAAEGITGGAGHDMLYGEGGADTLSGDMGDDLLDGGAGDDVLHDEYGSDTLLGGDGNDTLTAWGWDEDAPDSLDGGAGDDVLLAMNGSHMTGGEGADTFQTIQQGGAWPRVTDFDPASDNVVLEGAHDDSAITLLVTPNGLNTQVQVDGTTWMVLDGITPDQIDPATITIAA